ncbi:probable beta-D-xylosidase 6 [Tanacetum coccineum]
MSTTLTTIILTILTTITTITSSPTYPCHPPHNTHQFCNTSLSISTRAHALLSLLTLPEKVNRLCNNDTGIQRLNVPPYEWWSEALHGIASNGPGCDADAKIPTPLDAGVEF